MNEVDQINEYKHAMRTAIDLYYCADMMEEPVSHEELLERIVEILTEAIND